MSVEQCIAEIERAIGRGLSDDEAEQLALEVGDAWRRLNATDVDNADAALKEAIARRADEIETAAWVDKRNALLNMRARARMLDYIASQWADDPASGFMAYLGGVASERQGSRNSVAAAQDSLMKHYVGGFVTELESANLLREFRSGEYDRDIFRAARALGLEDDAALANLPKQAVEMARIIRKYQDKGRLDANDAGAWIGQVDEYVARQSHDPYRINQTEPDQWMDFVAERLDWDRSFPDVREAESQRDILRQLYSDFASGKHLAQPPEGPVTSLKGFGNLGRSMSRERVLHFRDGDASYDYMREFGRGTLAESIISQLDISAQNTALMRYMGPNAQNNFEQVVRVFERRIQKEGTVKQRTDFQSRVRSGPMGIERTLLPNLTGEARRPGSHMFARHSQTVRLIQQMSKLGGMVISAITDVPFYAATSAYNGRGFLHGLGEAIGGIATAKSSPEQRRVLSQMGVIADGMRATVAGRFDVSDQIPGRLAKLNNYFFKLNLGQWWTDRLRETFALARGHDMYLQRGKGFTNLEPEFQRALGLYGIDERQWDLYRSQEGMSDGEWSFMTPEGVDDVPEEAISNYLLAVGRRPTKRSMREAREQIKQNFRSYFADQASFAALTPDVRTRAVLLQGTQPGTVPGELARHVALFKSFPTSVLMKPLARELYGRGGLKGKGASFNDSPLWSTANLIVWNTAFGYLAMNAKEMLKGRTPRVPESAGEMRDVLLASMVQGGGAGIYGDFLFGDVRSRFGSTFVASLMGPTAGTADDLMNVYGRFVRGEDAAAALVRTGVSNTPFANLFYTRMALDYAVLHRLQEWTNPGSLRRTERNMEEMMGNEYWMRPSEHIPRGGF